ncbi:MAG TPA: FAD:protein FMN transferase, partial [Longimicrobiales bacterium]|nr:FAD:protein FMN transferase [Longimicrobiales bacterium]
MSRGGEASAPDHRIRRWLLTAGAVLVLIAVGWVRQTLRHGGGEAAHREPSRPAEPRSGVRTDRAWPVMGTIFQLSAFAPDSATSRAALVAGRAAVGRVDSLMSTYRPESEISGLNSAAGSGAWTELSAETATVLRTALRWARVSGGALDPTVGPLMHAWGFRGERAARPPPEVLDSALSLVGWSRVETEEDGARARLPMPGMAIDLGAIAKGY